MRDIVLTLLIFGCVPFILRRPFFGLLVWCWLSYMNPHKLTWGFAQSMPFAQIVAIALLVSLVVNNSFRRPPRIPMIPIWIIFLVWMSISTVFAIYPIGATNQLEKVLKIQLLTFITMMLVVDQDKMNKLVWVIAVSIGYYSVKGGVFTLLTGGAHRVYGPKLSYIAENNSLALATLVTIPLMIYLFHISRRKSVKLGLALAVMFSAVSALGSQSRGALLAILTVGAFFWLKSKNKLLSGIFLLIFASIGYNFMPQSWHDRMGSIANYQEDASAMGRINAWTYSINIANDRLTGGGFESWSYKTFAIYAPNPESVAAAHSIYFGVLGDHGWPGLILFLLVLLGSWRCLSRVLRQTKNDEALDHQNYLAKMLQVSLIAWMSGGAFLSLAYFDLPWHIIAMAVLLDQQTRSAIKPQLSSNTRLSQISSSMYKPGA